MTTLPRAAPVSAFAGPAVLLALIALAGCRSGRERSDLPTAPAPAPAIDEEASLVAEGEGASKPAVEDPCLERQRRVRPAPRDEELERYRAAIPEILVTTRTISALYFAAPSPSEGEDAARLRSSLGETRQPRRELASLLREHRDDRSLMRRIFLRQGYLFEHRPQVARGMVRELSYDDLFDAPQIHRYRKGGVEILTRGEDGYLDENGERAKLLLNDRVAEDPAELAEPLHLDLGAVRLETGALETIPRVVGRGEAVLDLAFPDGERRTALVRLEEGLTRVACVAGEGGGPVETRARASRFWERQRAYRESAERLVGERPRFDEPTDEAEDVQEDGELRLAWHKAYWRHKRKFKFREVEYPVFDRRGNAIPPQVCIDFVFDVWERASGTWYHPRGQRPGRTRGQVDFGRIPGLSRRYIPSLLEFASTGEAPIERYDVPRKDWIPIRRLSRFAERLAGHAHAIREGDALVIHGLREEDMEEHFHAVIVLETDPRLGLPTVVADNQGRPRIGSLYRAMRAAPRRSIKHRLRLDPDQMELFIERLALKDAGPR